MGTKSHLMTPSPSVPIRQQSGSSEPGPGGALGGIFARVVGAVPPPGLMLLAIVSIQVGAAVAVQLFATLGPEGTVLLRVGISALLLGIAWRPRIDERVRAHLGLLLLFGVLIGAMNLCFYNAIARIPLGIAVTIEFMGPLAVSVATSRRLAHFMWIGLAVFGVLLLAPDFGQRLDPVGLGFAALGGIGWACFIFLSIRVGRIFERGTGLALGMAVAAIFLLPFGFRGAAVAFVEPALLAVAFGVAVFSTAIPFSLEFEALKRVPPRVYGVLVTMEPVIAVIVGIVLLNETLTLRTALAVACVTVAAVGITLFDGRRPGK
jgi:inner membrane transporter RhtA